MSTVAAPSFPIEPTSLPTGANEELAGPPQLAPVSAADRISAIDTMRGFCLMGILLANITDFALPGWNYFFPLTTVKPVFNGAHWQINTIVWFLRWMFAEGRMRSVFSMLFGAGIILLTSRMEKRGAPVLGVFVRRNLWLILFGFLHCVLIWNGDILFYYGISALVLFPCRHLKPKALIAIGILFLIGNTLIVPVKQTIRTAHYKQAADQANAELALHETPTPAQIAALKNWESEERRWRPDTEALYEDIAAHQHGYIVSQRADVHDALEGMFRSAHTFGDWLSLMLFGMALFKLGFFSLKLPTRTYVISAIVGLGVSLPITFWGCWVAYRSGFDEFVTAHSLLYPADFTRVLGAVGYASVILLMVRGGVFRWLLARFAAVGQMAFSNYILNSLVMKTLFVWGPLHWYGYMDYYKLYLVVAAEWVVNMTFSTLWLKNFRFGPLEWCWRSLTYWKRQPMALPPAKPELVTAS
jgi:uncharacterized protein